MGRAGRPLTAWAPQPGPQVNLIRCPADEVFYGGARGGGKTDGMLGEWAIHANKYAKANGVFFRRTMTQLEEAIARSHEIYPKLGSKWKATSKTWVFPRGGRLKFRYLERDTDAENYQGHSYTRVYFEELTNFRSPDPVMKLMATLRSADGIPCRMRATGNPGGPGHLWVKHRYIDPAPNGYTPLIDPETGLTRVFIPAKLEDNQKLVRSDPMYEARIKSAGSKELVRAWLDGDWDIVIGAYFDCWNEWKAKGGIVRPFSIPKHWVRFRSFDWGSARPFSVGWWAVASEHHEQANIPTGALVRYREWYGAGAPNVGLKLDAEAVAEGIKERTAEKIDYGVADPAIFAVDGGPSIAERMIRCGVTFRRGDNRRVGEVGHAIGWDQVRARFQGDDRPMMYVFDTCTDFIRTIPALQHDEKRPEDLDSDGEDHVADEVRYACMSRPYVRPIAPKPEDVIARASRPPTFMEMVERNKRRRLNG